MNMCYARFPEYDINIDVVNALAKFYYDNQDQAQQYITQSGRPQSLFVLRGFQKPDFISRIENQFTNVKDAYFLANNGIDKHKDDGRYAVMNWCVVGALAAPTLFHDDEGNVIDSVDHQLGHAVLLNTKQWHSSPYQPIFRILFQVEFDDDSDFLGHYQRLITLR
jgi:hypothetical protein